MPKDYYEILGIGKNASKDEIKRAYRKLAHQHHPDKKGGDETKFKEINEAYQILSDDGKRRQYDQFGTGFNAQGSAGDGNWSGDYGDFTSGGFGDLGDIFEDLFGGLGRQGSRRRSRGSDISIEIDMPFAESIFGGRRSVILEKNSSCDVCRGSGAEPGSGVKKCTTCQGTGTVRENRRSIFGSFTSLRECSVCSGRGEMPEKICRHCRGAGVMRRQENINVEIPAGIRNGEAIKMTGLGEAIPNGSPGDLYIRIRVMPHSVFSRSGNDLTMDLNIPLTKMILGGEENIEILDGKITLKIAELSKPGDILRIKGKGVPKDRGGRGDLLITLHPKLPKKLSYNARRMLSDLESEGL